MRARSDSRRAARGSVVAATMLATGVLAAGVGLAGASSLTAPKWALRATPATSSYTLKSLACAGTGCVALGEYCAPGGCGGLLSNRSYYSANDGATWVTAAMASSIGDATAVSCGSATTCAATATRGPLGPGLASAIIVTTNGGRSWAAHIEAADNLSVAGCASRTACFAFGAPKGQSAGMTTLVLVSRDAGAKWVQHPFPAGKGLIEAASCGAPTSCVAGGVNTADTAGIVYRSVNAGSSWSAVKVPAGTSGIRDVSCNRIVCAALTTTQVLVSTDDGRSWSLHLQPTGPTYGSVACFNLTVCVLVGAPAAGHGRPSAAVSTNGGSSWAATALPGVVGSLASISCVPATCVAAGGRFVYHGSTLAATFPLALTY